MSHPNSDPVVSARINCSAEFSTISGVERRLTPVALALLAWSMLALTARAQPTVVVNPIDPYKPITFNYWAGVNTTNNLGVGNNTVTIGAPDTSTFNLAVAGQPSGLTTVLSTNSCTNSISLSLNLFATNVAAGTYPLTLSASGATSYSTNVNFFVVPQWAITNGPGANWSANGSWSGGAAPGPNDSAYIENMGGTGPGFTNIVDTTMSIKDLVILGDHDANFAAGTACAMQIPATVMLSVLGTNGFFIGAKGNNNTRPWYDFSGAGSLVVNNTAGNFAIANGASSSSTRLLSVIMTNLNNFSATVNRFGVGDNSLNAQGLVGGSTVSLSLARTNLIQTQFADDYNALAFQNALQFEANGDLGSGSVNATFNLGQTNAFFVDSIGVGRTGAQGTSGVGLTGGGHTMRFAPVFANSISPFSSAYFRSPSGGRISLIAVGVDSGTNSTGKNTKGTLDLRGGKIDMMVDQIWLGRNRTNNTAPTDAGAFIFDWGTVDANTVNVGYEEYTNNAIVNGYLVVGTNGTMSVHTNIMLGFTPALVTGFEAAAALTSGQIQINNGGTLHAKQISVGTLSGNNGITLNLGGTLDVSNTVASSATMLSGLTNSGGGLTLHINGTNTLVFASNLVASASSPINIASYSGLTSFPTSVHSTNIHVISYGNAITPNNWAGGTGPAGVIVGVANNPGNNSIDVTLTAGAAKSLLWKGYQDNTWNNSTKNWLDLNTGLQTNFATLDSVKFDDTASFSMVNVTEDVVPAQTGTGILVTNNSLSYTFTGSGAIRGAASLVKNGTGALTVDSYAESGVSLNQGSVTVTANGTIGSAVAAVSTTLANAGTVLGSVTCAGVATNAGTITTGLSLQNGGIMTNASSGAINGSLSLNTGSLLMNSGTTVNSGGTVGTNSTLINGGTLNFTGGLTVNAGGTLIDLVPNAIGSSPGSINVGTTLTIGAGATFIPGGSAIQTMKVAEYPQFTAQPAGGVFLAQDSTNIFNVNLTNSQPNTLLLANNQRFGPNHQTKAFDGCTLSIVNSGPPFSAGQTLHLFEYYQGGGNIVSPAGLNITNTYPTVIPSTPGPGLRWVLHDLYFSGDVKIVSLFDPAYNFFPTNGIAIGSSNIIWEFSWPTDSIGGWMEEQDDYVTNGLGGANWGYVRGSATVNDISITNSLNGPSAVFFRWVYP